MTDQIIPHRRRLLAVLPLLAALCALPQPLAAWSAGGPETRPALEQRQGRAFAYLLPRGWRANETSNGIDIAAPDGITGVAASVAVGGFGQPSPEAWLQQVLTWAGHSQVRALGSRPTPPQPGPMGLQWQGVEVELESLLGGRLIHIRALSHVLQGAGQFAAIVTGIQGPAEAWPALAQWLPRVRDAIRITDPNVITGSMANALPRGIRHDEIYGGYNAAWQARGVAYDDISRAQREATMGYKRLVDGETGTIYEMPLEAYDPTVGGWRNPLRPTDLLADTRN